MGKNICHKCQTDNAAEAIRCKNCQADLTATVEISKVDSDVSSLVKAMEEIQEKQLNDDTALIRDKNLPSSEAEWQAAIAEAKQKKDETSAKAEPDATLKKDEISPTAEAKTGEEEDETTELAQDEVLASVEIVEEKESPTDVLPPIDDDDHEQNIGAVRFRGELILVHQESGEEFHIEGKHLAEVLIGRCDAVTGFTPTVDLSEHGGKSKGVSRRHATISMRGDLLFITDHTSVNGTFLNGQRLVPEQARVVRDTDLLRIGRVDLLVHFKQKPAKA